MKFEIDVQKREQAGKGCGLANFDVMAESPPCSMAMVNRSYYQWSPKLRGILSCPKLGTQVY